MNLFLHAPQREKSISMAQGQQVLSAFQTHWNTQYFMIQVEQAVTQLAGQLVFQHPLRAYDAIQLAAALSLQRQLSLPDVHSFIFLTADDRLCAVAQATGIATENPISIPNPEQPMPALASVAIPQDATSVGPIGSV